MNGSGGVRDGESRPFTITSDASQLDGVNSPGGILQWAVRFCQAPESLPVFLNWVRSIWTDCPFSDKEIADDLVRGHDLVTLMLRSGMIRGSCP